MKASWAALMKRVQEGVDRKLDKMKSTSSGSGIRPPQGQQLQPSPPGQGQAPSRSSIRTGVGDTQQEIQDEASSQEPEYEVFHTEATPLIAAMAAGARNTTG